MGSDPTQINQQGGLLGQQGLANVQQRAANDALELQDAVTQDDASPFTPEMLLRLRTLSEGRGAAAGGGGPDPDPVPGPGPQYPLGPRRDPYGPMGPPLGPIPGQALGSYMGGGGGGLFGPDPQMSGK